jgi:hypothetical protein
MKRPARIYELLGKVSDGTFLNEKEFRELETYISDIEEKVPNCSMCNHSSFNHHVIDDGKQLVVECYETNECNCSTSYSESTSPTQSEQ